MIVLYRKLVLWKRPAKSASSGIVLHFEPWHFSKKGSQEPTFMSLVCLWGQWQTWNREKENKK